MTAGIGGITAIPARVTMGIDLNFENGTNLTVSGTLEGVGVTAAGGLIGDTVVHRGRTRGIVPGTQAERRTAAVCASAGV